MAPGDSPGTLAIDGDLILGSDSILDYELDGLLDVNDLIEISGDLTLDGMLNITDLGNFETGTYSLLTYGGALTDNILDVGTAPAAGSMPYVYSISTGTPGQVDLMVEQVLEPAGAVLLLLGGLGLLLGRRRKA